MAQPQGGQMNRAEGLCAVDAQPDAAQAQVNASAPPTSARREGMIIRFGSALRIGADIRSG
jgi:hypothetical protein